MTSIKKTIKGLCHKPKQSQIMSQDPTDTDQWKKKAHVFRRSKQVIERSEA